MTAPAKLKESETKRFPDNLPVMWQKLLSKEIEAEYFQQLTRFLREEIQRGQVIYPEQKRVLRALQEVDYPEVKVVLLGQDPYHGPGQAIGRCFAVPNELKVKPPSLTNIFKELESDLKVQWNKKDSDLSGWSSQGVLLLNAVLTVRKSQAFSHRDKGWEIFTDQIIHHLSERTQPVIFFLWGAAAQKKKNIIDLSRHYILEAPHPSPLSASRGFFGSKHFSQANHILREKLNSKPIDWAQISLT